MAAGPRDGASRRRVAVTIISGDGLTLRPWQPNEADALLEIRANPDVAKWLGSPEPWRDRAQALNEIATWQTRLDHNYPFGTWAMVPDGFTTPVGGANLGRIRDGSEVEIGWYLHPQATGHGWATKAARALLSHGIAAGIPRIWALMWRQNDASARVARSSGMRELGVLVDPWYGSEQDAYSRMFIARPDTHST